MHRVRIVQSMHLLPINERLTAIRKAGFNTFGLPNRDVFIDMLTDSGTNAMSDNQLAAMMQSDDAYAGSESFTRLGKAVRDILGFRLILPTHQGRAAEHLLAKTFVQPGNVVIMNYHFTTSKVHMILAGGTVEELCIDEAFNTQSVNPFKGNMDLKKLRQSIKTHGAENIAFIRMEATTNLLGGQPFSLQNLRDVNMIAKSHHIPLVLDGSLISENAVLIKRREKECADMSVAMIIKAMMKQCDIFYFSGRKSSSARGGMIATNNKKLFDRIKPLLPVFEGFFTYGGMSCKEIEAMAVGLREMTRDGIADAGVDFVDFFVRRCEEEHIPVVTPAGGLACHIDAKRFVDHIPQEQYPAGALAAAIFIISGIRGMERGTLSMERDAQGNEVLSDLELVRLAIPRRVFTMSHIEFAVDRVRWLFDHRDLIGGLKFIDEPPMLRFFVGKLQPIGNWDTALVEAFKKDFGTGA